MRRDQGSSLWSPSEWPRSVQVLLPVISVVFFTCTPLGIMGAAPRHRMLERVRACAAATAALGEPIDVAWFAPAFDIQLPRSSHPVLLRVKGPLGRGRYHFTLHRGFGGSYFTSNETLQVDGRTIDIARCAPDPQAIDIPLHKD